MNRKKKIFENNTPLSKEEIDSYLNSDLSEAEKYQMEQKIASNDFNSDAMEGFENTPGSLEGFNELENKFHSNLPRRISSSFWRFEYSVILILVFAIGLYFVGHHFLVEASLIKEEFDKKVVEKTQKEIQENKIEIVIPPVLELNDEEIEAATPLEENKQLTSEKIIVEAPITIDSVLSQEKNIDSTINSITVQKEKVNLELADKKEIPVVDKSTIVYSNANTLFLSQLLVVDYSKIYTEAITVPNFELSGTTADRENKDDQVDPELEVQSFTKKIAYTDFLESTQLKFRKNQFKDALKGYRTILNHYPNDVNAHFYSALCYFNINKQKKAIEHFNRVLDHEFNTFHEEAQWYKAISLYELGKTSKCITILNKIANANGFYAEKANNMLNDI